MATRFGITEDTEKRLRQINFRKELLLSAVEQFEKGHGAFLASIIREKLEHPNSGGEV
ncbi:hypothetical protein SAMN05421737_103251 [Shouchella lonarensis]|uniref:Uncharacterized protein n=1 Tax=Shouchella lonarensis TaxID=1464122 RepID=A0A1G6HGX7_9BACI|nr:hypothetical protein SAMN05421737_103251 [Shouchella lonarensis]